MSPLQHYSMRVLRRWPVIVALALVGAVASTVWFFATATTTYTATTALSTQSAERGPEQDAVLALGYVDYFNQENYQQLMRREASIPADVTLSAVTGATSPILYISATAPDEQVARDAAADAAETFRSDVYASLVEERRRAADDIQAEIDRNTAELVGPEVLQDVQINIVLDQIRSLQGRLTDIMSDNTNHLKTLQPAPGVSSETPSPVISIAMGATGGALLGVLLALVLLVADVRVRGRVDVRQRLGVDALADLGGGLAEDERARRVRTLANSLRPTGAVPRGRTVVAVVAPRHSAASATLARELAASAASGRGRAVLVRADLTIAGDGTGGARPGFVDALSGRRRARELVASAPDGLRILPAGAVPGGDPFPLVDPGRVSQVLGEVSEGCALAVLDAPPLLDAPESQIICAAADRVLLVLDRGTTRWTDAREASALLAEVDASLTGVVIDDPREEASRDELPDVAPVDATTKLPQVSANGAGRVPDTQRAVAPGDATTELPQMSGNGAGPGTAAPNSDAARAVPSPRPHPSAVPVGARADSHRPPLAGRPGHE